jgi:hypothetical protein
LTYHYNSIEKLLKEAGRDQSLLDISTYIKRLTTDERLRLRTMLGTIEAQMCDIEYEQIFGGDDENTTNT